MAHTPTLYIIAGPNGAGKTTASYTVLPAVLQCKEFVNADEIARGLSPFNPQSMAIEAGRLMLERIRALLAERASFSIETTLATRSYVRLIEQAHAAGYMVSLVFFHLNSPALARQRVDLRVKDGGHDIPTAVIYRRYWAGLRNFFQLYAPIVDAWLLVDNSAQPRTQIAAWSGETGLQITNPERYNRLISL